MRDQGLDVAKICMPSFTPYFNTTYQSSAEEHRPHEEPRSRQDRARAHPGLFRLCARGCREQGK